MEQRAFLEGAGGDILDDERAGGEGRRQMRLRERTSGEDGAVATS